MDFGGTKLLIGEVDAQGNILRRKRYPSGCREEADAVRVLTDSLRDYMRGQRVCTGRRELGG